MKVNHLLKSYGEKTVVDNVSFELPKNKVISFIGPNGAGKSTVLNIITRLIDRDNGDIRLDDKDIKEWQSNKLAKKLAILTQHNHTMMKLTVWELVSFGRFPHSGSNLQDEDYHSIEEAINYMELNEYRDTYIDELSGGQRQRAFIAMVIAQDTEYIFLDEPTNSLDIYHSSRLMQTIRDLCDNLGKTVILVLHEINFASKYSDYIGAFKNGKLYQFGTIEEVMTVQNLKDLYNVDFEISMIDGKPIALYY